MASNDPMIAALLRERDGYQRTGQTERAAAVDEQLRARGHQDGTSAGDQQARSEPPKGRGKAPKQTVTAQGSTEAAEVTDTAGAADTDAPLRP